MRLRVALLCCVPALVSLAAPSARCGEDLLAAEQARRLRSEHVVVLDAGHGGKDRGTEASGLITEKAVVLGITRAAAAHLRRHAGIEVKMTRERDEFVPLENRLALARESEADCFVSVHANSAPNRSAHGAEVYFLSLDGADSEAERASEDRENAAALVGSESAARADDELLSFLVDLRGNAAMQRSAVLAQTVLERLGGVSEGSGRSVRQANFVVLRTLNMPSILVEVGFLSHAQEARRLASSEGQARIGHALAAAIVDYLAASGERSPLGALPEPSVHEVRRGDTLWSLARASGNSVAVLREVNVLRGDALRVGQTLLLPGAPPERGR